LDPLLTFNPKQSFYNISIIKICKPILSGQLRYAVTALLEIHKTQVMDYHTMQVHGYYVVGSTVALPSFTSVVHSHYTVFIACESTSHYLL